MRLEVIRALECALRRDNGGHLRPAPAKWIRRAEEFGFPHELIEFYRDHEPHHRGWGYVELGYNDPDQYQRRLWCIKQALKSNGDDDLRVLNSHGYIAFASILSGDVYCIDTNTTKKGLHPVVLFFRDDLFTMKTRSAVRKHRLEVAASLEDFLSKFAAGTLIDHP